MLCGISCDLFSFLISGKSEYFSMRRRIVSTSSKILSDDFSVLFSFLKISIKGSSRADVRWFHKSSGLGRTTEKLVILSAARSSRSYSNLMSDETIKHQRHLIILSYKYRYALIICGISYKILFVYIFDTKTC